VEFVVVVFTKEVFSSVTFSSVTFSSVTYIYIYSASYIYIYIYHKVLSMKLQNSLMDIQDAILPTQMFSLALHSTAA